MKNVKYGKCVRCGKTYDAVPDLTNCECGGILDIVYDYDYIKSVLTKEKLAKRENRSMWRYRELLPVEETTPDTPLRVGWSPLYEEPKLAELLGIKKLWVKDDGQNPTASLKDVDVTLMLFEPTGEFTESELGMVEALRKAGPAIAVINKVDLLNDFAALEARKKQVEEFGIFDAIVTVSAKDGTGCEELFPLLKQYANPGPHYFDDDAFTDMPEKELVAELVREKALLFMREEIPHGIAVTVESFKERPDSDLIDISVEICCERKSHKGMIIGKGGQMLKKIASAARMDCEELLGARVNLQCWVKVREDWRDNDRLLDNLGFAKP